MFGDVGLVVEGCRASGNSRILVLFEMGNFVFWGGLLNILRFPLVSLIRALYTNVFSKGANGRPSIPFLGFCITKAEKCWVLVGLDWPNGTDRTQLHIESCFT